MIQTETIAAISTAPGVGGIAVIRVSGHNAISVCNSLFVPNREGRNLSMIKAQQAVYGTFADIDHVVVTIYKSPYSFTGEDVVEISCHGSLYIQNAILQRLIDAGCRLADHGEFTMRAFLNGRIDLAEAEAVADLVGAKSAEAHRLALRQMQGALSTRLKELREKLLELTSLLELELDFSDHEDVEFADRTKLAQLIDETENEIARLMHSFSSGNAIKNGITVAIVGAPNAGKSTLLNRLIGDDCAIVSDIPGTTRDTIERTLIYRGLLFRFIDTAGIHQTDDVIENLGIERSYKAMSNARVIVALSENGNFSNLNLKGVSKHSKLVICRSKSDIYPICEDISKTDEISISALTGYNIDRLMERLFELAEIDNTEDVIITTQRHYEALKLALEDIKKIKDCLAENVSSDFIAEDLRSCLGHIGEITGGTITADETLQNIFSHFCIGK